MNLLHKLPSALDRTPTAGLRRWPSFHTRSGRVIWRSLGVDGATRHVRDVPELSWERKRASGTGVPVSLPSRLHRSSTNRIICGSGRNGHSQGGQEWQCSSPPAADETAGLVLLA